MIQLDNATVYLGSNLDILPTLPGNSVDSIVTDPPYELGFMGKKWDSSGIAYSVELWQQCYRVLKPGGHLLAFGGSRTWHRLAVAIEDAGFEMRDSIAWLYGSGFPKSMDVSKAINKAAGAEREVTGYVVAGIAPGQGNAVGGAKPLVEKKEIALTDEAKKWAGWGTALKPAFEPVVVARKPLIGTVAANVLEWGVGGLNIDGSRIGTEERINQPAGSAGLLDRNSFPNGSEPNTVQGRWPANVAFDEDCAGLLDEQAPATGAFAKVKSGHSGKSQGIYGDYEQRGDDGATFYGDGLGGASRFFYVAKASKKDRNEGLDGLEPQRHSDRENAEGVGGDNPRNRTNEAKQNFHPTVKPTALMEYLIRLVTPAGGVVLDPFTGSGSTGKAALLNGYRFIGCELTEEYFPIIEGRLKHAAKQYAAKATEEETKEQETLF